MTAWGGREGAGDALDDRRRGMLAGLGAEDRDLGRRAVGPRPGPDVGRWLQVHLERLGPRVRTLGWREKPRVEGLPWGDRGGAADRPGWGCGKSWGSLCAEAEGSSGAGTPSWHLVVPHRAQGLAPRTGYQPGLPAGPRLTSKGTSQAAWMCHP